MCEGCEWREVCEGCEWRECVKGVSGGERVKSVGEGDNLPHLSLVPFVRGSSQSVSSQKPGYTSWTTL